MFFPVGRFFAARLRAAWYASRYVGPARPTRRGVKGPRKGEYMIIEMRGKRPDVEGALFIAPDAVISGDVHLAEDTSIWFHAVLRAEDESITIGARSNVQDHVMIHADFDLPVTVGEGVSIGHNAIVHGCTIEDDVLIGMGATVMNGAVIGKGSVVAAGALVLQGTVIPPYSVVAGVPGKVKKTISEEVAATNRRNNNIYLKDARDYAEALGL